MIKKCLIRYFILFSIFSTAYAVEAKVKDNNDIIAQGGTLEDQLARMRRFDQLNQLFDSPFLKYGIGDISSIFAVEIWDFDLFADYIIQEGENELKLATDNFIKNESEQTLTIRLSSDTLDSCPLPAEELKVSFNSSIGDQDRTLSLTYTIPVTRDNQQELYQKCIDMLADTWKDESESDLTFEGPYRHIYTIGKDDESILFTCQISVPASLWYHIPAGYVPQISYAELSEQAPCNSGHEPFSQFLKKFNKDTAFRIDRRANSDRANYADSASGYPIGIQFGFNKLVLTALKEAGLLPLRGHFSQKEYKTKNGGETEIKESCGQWFYPTTNSVIYSGWNSDTGNPENDCSIIILFERIDDEWNTTATWYSGVRLNDIVKRLMQEMSE